MLQFLKLPRKFTEQTKVICDGECWYEHNTGNKI